jgi:hypothetical protein
MTELLTRLAESHKRTFGKFDDKLKQRLVGQIIYSMDSSELAQACEIRDHQELLNMPSYGLLEHTIVNNPPLDSANLALLTDPVESVAIDGRVEGATTTGD